MASDRQLKWRIADPITVAKGDFICLQLPGKFPSYGTVTGIEYSSSTGMYFLSFSDGTFTLVGAQDGCLRKFSQ